MSDIQSLKHVRRPIPGGGHVTVLNTGALIGPEAEAMLQALHSRSLGGIDAHLAKLAQKGAKQFMDTYYVGYGDKSIGDCGTTTVFIEGVSMLAAKAVQDSMLYNGQEASTRYIDFAKQRFVDPLGAVGTDLLESLRVFHLEGLDVMRGELSRRHPCQEGEGEKVWQKAINARAFDVMRGFLPAGASTNLAWHSELRHAADHLQRLRSHPLLEVRLMAQALLGALDEACPSSFKQKTYEATEAYTRRWMEELYYFNTGPRSLLETDTIDKNLIQEYYNVLMDRPVKAEPPKFLAECGSMRFSFLLDFGSFRDLQRHRALVQRMPLLTTSHGFSDWYLNQMPDALRYRAREFLGNYGRKLDRMKMTPLERQYYVPMGYQVTCRMTGDLPALIWFVELRSGVNVHPTLRVIAQNIGRVMLKSLARHGLKLYVDESPDRFNYKRGVHDIVERVAAT